MSKLNFNQVQKIKAPKASTPQNRFLAGQTLATKTARTENNAVAYSSTGHKLSDFFSRFGAMRSSSEQEILATFQDLYEVMPKEAVKLLMFFRDCRGGQGERRVFDVVFNWFIKTNNPLAYQLLTFVPEVGYWKDVRDYMVAAVNYGNRDFLEYASLLYATKLKIDTGAKNMSLAAKWAPTENWSRKNSTNKTVWISFFKAVREVGLASGFEEYRKLISLMRLTLGVTERTMSDREWENIDFASVPSKAHALYRKAFGKHQQLRYAEYLLSVQKGEKKINAGVLTPVEIMHKYLNAYGIDTTLEEQWKALPNYVNDDVLAVCDVSGSMSGRPMEISVALGIYLAQRATGICKNELVTFSEKPTFFDISGYKNLRQTIDAVQQMDWGFNTNIEKTFDLLLKTAKQNNATDKDMPKYILIISDLQFDRCTNANRTPFEEIKRKFAAQSLTMPKIVFWQVNATNHKAFPVPDEFGTIQISGESPAVLNFVLGVLNNNSMQVIENILNNPRYAFVDNLECWGLE